MVRIKLSAGDDFVELWNGSIVHFGGLDDPGRWDSAELGALCFDEAHEIKQEDIVLIVNTRMKAEMHPDCHAAAATYLDPRNAPDCDHYPHSMILTFNPMFPRTLADAVVHHGRGSDAG